MKWKLERRVEELLKRNEDRLEKAEELIGEEGIKTLLARLLLSGEGIIEVILTEDPEEKKLARLVRIGRFNQAGETYDYYQLTILSRYYHPYPIDVIRHEVKIIIEWR